MKAEIVPLALAYGWNRVKLPASRNYSYWWGRFNFERGAPWCVELLDIGYKYGWRARVRTHYVRLAGDENELQQTGQGGFEGRWCWPASGSLIWLAYRLFCPAPDLVRFAIEDAKQQLAILEPYSVTGERPDRPDFSMDFQPTTRPWLDDERALFDAAIAAQGS